LPAVVGRAPALSILSLISRRDKIPVLHREQALAERSKRTCALAVGPFGSNVADEQAEDAGHERREDLLIELRQIEERGQRKEERGETGGARQDRVADLLCRACLHSVCASREGDARLCPRDTEAGLRNCQRPALLRRRTI